MTTGENLYRLQVLDAEADAKRRHLVEVQAALQERAALDQALKALEDAAAHAHRRTARQRNLDLESRGLEEKVAAAEQKLYGGTIKQAKPLEELQADIASMRRRQQKLDDDLLEAMIERDDADAQVVRARADLTQAEAQHASRQAALLAEQESLRLRLAELQQANNELLTCISAGDLAIYRTLRQRKGGVAVAQVRGDACALCGVAVSPNRQWQLREGKLVTCSNCERIVVLV